MIKWLICLLAVGAVANVIRSGSTGQQMKPKLNCTEVGNGNFVYGCSKVFWMCSNGILYAQHCHSELFFDPVSNACERQENIELCNTQNMTNLHGPSKATEAFNCKGKIDNSYELTPCLQRFAHCKSGHVFYEGCPTGTVYDDTKKHCDWPANVVGCQDKERLSSRSPPDGEKAAAAPGYGPQDVPSPSFVHQQSSYGRQFKISPKNNSQQNETLTYQFPQITPIEHQPVGPPRTDSQPKQQSSQKSDQHQPQLQPSPPQQPQQTQSHQMSQPPKQDQHQKQQSTPQQQALPHSLSAYRHEFDCAGKQDGYYPSPSNACAPFFYKCSGNVTYRYNCPYRLYFSAQKRHCDFLNKVPECNGHVLPYPNGPLTVNTQNYTVDPVQQPSQSNSSQNMVQQQPTTQNFQVKPALKIDFNCADKDDGFYTIGKCRNDYVRCVSKTAYLQECPENFVFDSDICEYMDECFKNNPHLQNNQQHVPTNVIQAQQPAAPAPSTQTYTLKQAQQRAVDQTQQSYNPVVQRPNQEAISPQSQPSLSSYGQQQIQQQPEQSNLAQQKPPVSQLNDTFCQEKGLLHGYHSPGCSNHYFACFPQTTLRFHCPANLFYDAEAEKCDYKVNVPACGGTRPTQPPAQQPQLHSSYAQQNVQAQPLAVQQQTNQAYEPQQAQHTPAVQQNQPSYSQHSQVASQPQIQLPHNLPSSQTEHHHQQETIHQAVSLNLQNSYDSRSQPSNVQHDIPQQQTAASAPPAWVPYPAYQTQQQQPAHQATVTQSQVQYQTQPQQTVQQTGVATNYYAQQNVQNSPPKIVETFCRDNNRKDGFNGAGCAPYFFVCTLGDSTRLHCPPGLYYDEEINECGLKTTITACGGQKSAAQTQQQQPLSQGSYRNPSSPVQQEQPAASEFDCQQKRDGVYVNGCSSKYFICNQQKSKTLYCPPGTYYSTSTEHCDYKAHVIECGGTPLPISPNSQHPVLIPQKPVVHYQFVQQMQEQQPAASNYQFKYNPQIKNNIQWQSTKKQPFGINYPPLQQIQQNAPAPQTSSAPATSIPQPFVEDDKCETLSNGIYGNKCSKFFFVCVENKSFEFMCPQDQAFNVVTVKCAPRSEISVCPEYAATSQQPAVVKPQSNQLYNHQQLQQQPQQLRQPATPSVAYQRNQQQAPQNSINNQLRNEYIQNQPVQQQPQQPAATSAPPAWVPYSASQQQVQLQQPDTRMTYNQIQAQQPPVATPAPAWIPYSAHRAPQQQVHQNHPAQQATMTQSQAHYQTQAVQQHPHHPQPQQYHNNLPPPLQQTPPQPSNNVQQSYHAQQPIVSQPSTLQHSAQQQSFGYQSTQERMLLQQPATIPQQHSYQSVPHSQPNEQQHQPIPAQQNPPVTHASY